MYCGLPEYYLLSLHMQLTNIKRGEHAFFATWSDLSDAEFPFVWLRDNAVDELHPDTRERLFDLTRVSLDILPDKFEFFSDKLMVTWSDRSSPSTYTAVWLQSNKPGLARLDPSQMHYELWNNACSSEIPSFDATACTGSKEVLRQSLLTLKCSGLVIIDGLEDDICAGENFGDLIGFKRRTNFGVMFEVISKPKPDNLAYTAIALPLHTDLPNNVQIPCYQFLHCFRNNAKGGASIFADGFQICADFAREEPDMFDLLKKVSIPWRYHDEYCDIRYHRPVIMQSPNGFFELFTFNAHLADVPDMDAKLMYAFYAAYQNLMKRVRNPKYSLQHVLQPGQMVMFDNRRILHGRDAFDPGSGERHYRGFYIEQNEVDSKIRVISRN